MTDRRRRGRKPKVTGDAAFKRNMIADAEIICPGFQPAGDKGLKRQVLSHAMRTGDSLKSFGVDDFAKRQSLRSTRYLLPLWKCIRRKTSCPAE
jgi:hypothetical protein